MIHVRHGDGAALPRFRPDSFLHHSDYLSVMKTHFSRFAVLGCAIVGLLLTVPASAQNLKAERQRMEQRLASIDALKDRGAVGENNRGYLEARTNLAADAAQLVSAENADRSAVYGALAQKTGTSAEQVGRARAKQIAQNSKPGVWIQHDNGQWQKK